jgi:hypothetical protein
MITWILIIVGVLIVSFPILVQVLANKSGWKALAQQYRFSEKPGRAKGVRLSVFSATIGGFSYQNVLRFKSAKKGLIVWMIWPFNISHKAIVIPWNAFEKVEETQGTMAAVMRLHIGKPSITTLDFRKKDYDRIKKELRLKTLRK